MRKYYLRFIPVLMVLLFLFSCGGGGGGSSSASSGSSLVSITVGGSGSAASLKIEKNTLYAQAKIFLRKIFKSNEAVAAIPANVSSIAFTISAPDMPTMTRTVAISGQTSITETFTVPNGTSRYFGVDAYDSGNTLLYSGNTYANASGTTISLSINMTYVRVTILVANNGNNTVSVIDASTNSVIATIAVGVGAKGVSVNPVTRLAYVTNVSDNTVSVIDIVTNTVVNTIALPTASPTGVAVDTANNKVFISNNYTNDGVDVINAAAGNSVSTVLFGGAYALGVAVNPNINRTYSNDWGDLYVIDTVTNSLVGGPLAVGGDTSPFGIAVNPLTNRVYLTWFTSTGTVYVIDGVSNSLITTVAVGMDPTGVGIHSTANKAYVANSGTNNVSVIDLVGNTVIATINVGTTPEGLAVDPGANRAYVANSGSGTISVIDTTTDTVIATITVGTSPMGVAVSR